MQSTMAMLKSSILTDRHVLLWFTLLVTRPSMRSWIDQDRECRKVYASLSWNTCLLNLTTIALIVALIVVMGFRSCVLGWVIALLVVSLLALNVLRKKQIAFIGGKVIESHVQDYRERTLYQICEFLASSFAVPSLTDLLSAVDNIYRRALMGTFFLAFFIVPLSWWDAVAFVFLSNVIVWLMVSVPMSLRYIQ